MPLRPALGRNRLAAAAALALTCSSALAPARAQNIQALDLPTTNNSQTIATGNTYQQLLPALAFGVDSARKSLTVQNNNASDSCYLIIGSIGGQVVGGTTTTSTNVTINGKTLTAQQASILLTTGVPYTRYLPAIPSDALFVTCANAGDSVYVDVQ
jgi:hypothetical protein